MTPTRELQISKLLQACFERSETFCVRECCGLDAFDLDGTVIREWARQVGAAETAQALADVRQLIEVCDDRSCIVSSDFLNACTPDEASRVELLTFLRAYEAALAASF